MAMYAGVKEELRIAHIFLQKARLQVFILDRRIQEVARRLKKAEESRFHPLRNLLSLRLSVLEGIRNMFDEYSAKKAEQVAELHRQITDMGHQRQNIEIDLGMPNMELDLSLDEDSSDDVINGVYRGGD